MSCPQGNDSVTFSFQVTWNPVNILREVASFFQSLDMTLGFMLLGQTFTQLTLKNAEVGAPAICLVKNLCVTFESPQT